MKLTLAGSVSDYTAAVQREIKEEIAADTGCSISEIALTIEAGSVIVTATLPSKAAAKLVADVNSGKVRLLGGQDIKSVALVGGAGGGGGTDQNNGGGESTAKESPPSGGAIAGMVGGCLLLIGLITAGVSWQWIDGSRLIMPAERIVNHAAGYCHSKTEKAQQHDQASWCSNQRCRLVTATLACKPEVACLYHTCFLCTMKAHFL